MMPTKQETVVISRVDGGTVRAEVIICPKCKSDTFHVYVLEGGHNHLQCTECDESYCDGKCGTPGS